MKQRLTVMLLALAAVLTAIALPVSQQQARRQAAQFALSHRSLSRGAASVQAVEKSMQTAIETPEYYAFNLGSDGFVIVSGDDRTAPILGYAGQGTLQPGQMPFSMRILLDSYAHDIRLVQQGAAAAPARRAERAAVAPLLDGIVWGQDAPDNGMTPLVDGQHAVTGCVATAMSQVMRYHRWPEATSLEIPGYSYYLDGELMTVPALPVTTFDWDKLAANDGDERAKLAAYSGSAVRMTYSGRLSSAYNTDIAGALTTYFGYDGGIAYYNRLGFTIDQWEALIYDELAASRPVIIGGQSSGGGHAFVCDGYDGEGLFHINWGWYGYCDGHFSLSLLDPMGGSTGASSTPDGYSMDQTAVVGIQRPTGAPAVSDMRLTLRELELKSEGSVTRPGSSEPFSGISVYMAQWNQTHHTMTGNVGLGLYNQSGSLEQVLASSRVTLETSYYQYGTYDVSISSTIADGTYVIAPICQQDGETTWRKTLGSDYRYVEAVVEGNSLTLTQYPTSRLSVLSLEYPGGRHVGQWNELLATVANEGSEFNGSLFVMVDGRMMSAGGAYIRGGDTAQLKFHFVPSNSAAQQITITTRNTADYAAYAIYSGPDEKAMPQTTGKALQLSSFALTSTSPYAKSGTSIGASVSIADVGSEAVTSYALAYSIDSQAPVALATVPQLAYGTAFCPVSIDLPADIAAGSHTVKLTVTAIDGAAPQDFEGHEATLTFNSYTEDLGREKVLLSYFAYNFTGTYPLEVERLLASLKGSEVKDKMATVAFHLADDLELPAMRSEYAHTIANSFPQINVDRYAEAGSSVLQSVMIDSEKIKSSVLSLATTPSFATVTLSARAAEGGKVEITASGRRNGDFLPLVGEANLTLILTEDGAQGRIYDGSDWTDYAHQSVARQVLTAPWGDAVSWTDDNTFTATYSFTPLSSWDVSKMTVVALLGKGFNGSNVTDLRLENCTDLPLAGIVLNSEPEATLDKLAFKTSADGTAVASAKSASVSGDVVVPEKYEEDGTTYTVVALADEAFKGTAITSIKLPATVETIGRYAFSGSAIADFTLPSTVRVLGAGALSNCAKLANLAVENGSAYYKMAGDALTTIDGTTLVAYAMGNGKSTYTLPEGVITVGEAAFQGAPSLNTVNVPEGVATLQAYAFSNIVSQYVYVTRINLPSTLTEIGHDCFNGCVQLRSITLPDGLTAIADGTFQGAGLSSVTLPGSIASVGSKAFADPLALATVTVRRAVPPVASADAFSPQTCNSATLVVPDRRVSAYQEAEVWSSFLNVKGEAMADVQPSDNPFVDTDDNQMIVGFDRGDTYSDDAPRGGLAPGTYKAAVALDSLITLPLKGNKLTHVRFALAGNKVGSVRVFVAETLDGEPLSSQNVAEVESGWNAVKLDNPVEITGQPLVIGYEYQAEAGEGNVVATIDNAAEPVTATRNAFWLYTPDALWTSLGAQTGAAIQAIADGTSLPDYDLRLTIVTAADRFFKTGDELSGLYIVKNSGRKMVKAATLAADFDGEDPSTLPVELTNIGATGRATGSYSLRVGKALTAGGHQMRVYLQTINGAEPQHTQADTLSLSLTAYTEALPRQKVLLELVGSQDDEALLTTELKEQNADLAVVNMHVADTLATTEGAALGSVLTRRSPAYFFDRYTHVGLTQLFSADETDLDFVRSLPSLASIAIEAEKADTLFTIKVKGDVAADFDKLVDTATLTVHLTEDSIVAPQRTQAEEGGVSTNYVHNDVLRHTATAAWGDTLIVAEGSYEHVYTVKVNPKWRLGQMHVVAFIAAPYDAAHPALDGLRVLQAESFALKDATDTAIRNVFTESSAIETRYDLNGRRLQKPRRGLNIVRRADGTVRKVVVR